MTGGSLDVPHDPLNVLGSSHAFDTELRYHDGLPWPMSLRGNHESREGSMLPALIAGQNILCSLTLLMHPYLYQLMIDQDQNRNCPIVPQLMNATPQGDHTHRWKLKVILTRSQYNE